MCMMIGAMIPFDLFLANPIKIATIACVIKMNGLNNEWANPKNSDEIINAVVKLVVLFT